MSTIILDDYLVYLYEAEQCLNQYKEIDSYMEIFEAENPEVKEQMETNEKAKAGAIENIKKAVKSLLEMLKNVMASVRNFIDKRKLSADEQEAYKQFKEAAKKDPSLKNKKITVRDFKKLTDEYQARMKEIEDAELEIAKGKVPDAKVLGEKVANFTKTAAKAPVTAVSAETALRMASSSRDIARIMYKKLENDEKFFQKAVDGIGEKQAEKLKKDMKSLSQKMSLKRMKMRLTGAYSKSCEAAVIGMVTDVKTLVGQNPEADMKEVAKAGVRQTATLKKMAGNESLSKLDDGVKLAGKVAGDVIIKSKIEDKKDERSAKKYDREYKKAEKKAEKVKKKAIKKGMAVPKKALNPENYMKKRFHNQSALDSILGLNDPESKIGKSKIVQKAKSGLETASRVSKVTSKYQ